MLNNHTTILNIFHSYSTFAIINEPVSPHCCNIKPIHYTNLISHLVSLSHSRHVPWGFFSAATQTFIMFHYLDSYTALKSRRIFLRWALFDSFLTFELGFWYWRRKTTGIRHSFHLLLSLDHTGEGTAVRCTPPPPWSDPLPSPILHPLPRGHCDSHQPDLGSDALRATSLGVENHLNKLLELLSLRG